MMDRIARLLGAPSERIWPGMASLPLAGTLRLPHQPYNNLRRVREEGMLILMGGVQLLQLRSTQLPRSSAALA